MKPGRYSHYVHSAEQRRSGAYASPQIPNADALRDRITKARQETTDRLGSKSLPGMGSKQDPESPSSVNQGRYSQALNQSALEGGPDTNKQIQFYKGVPANSQDPFRPNQMGLVFVTPDQEEAKVFAGFHGTVVPVQVSTDNIFDGTNPDHLAKAGYDPGDAQDLRLFDSAYVENPHDIAQIKSAEFDGFYVRDFPPYPRGFWNIALFGSDNLVVSSITHQQDGQL